MPTYEYECPKCETINDLIHGMNEEVEAYCEDCDVVCHKVYTRAPGVVVPPQHQAVQDKLKYYGVTDPITGAGITKDTDVRDKPGIRVKSKG